MIGGAVYLGGWWCTLGSGPQSGVTLSVSSPPGRAYGFGTLPHQAEIGWQHGVHKLWILGWQLGED